MIVHDAQIRVQIDNEQLNVSCTYGWYSII